MLGALAIEAFLALPGAAEWAGAIGGFLAVLAAAIIAMHQSQQNRRALEAQTRIATASLAAQQAMTAASLETQERLQRASFDFQIEATSRERAHARAGAIGALSAAYSLVASIAKCLDVDGGPSEVFVRTWAPDAELAISLSRSVQYGHLSNPDDVLAVSTICIRITDAWDNIKLASEVDDDGQRHFRRAVAKGKVLGIQRWLRILSSDWKALETDAFGFTPEEVSALGPNSPFSDLVVETQGQSLA